MTNVQSSRSSSGDGERCADCDAAGATARVELFDRAVVMLCDGCSDRRATRCPFCGSTFGREVKRTSRCKKCGETVARSRATPFLATRLASGSICDALAELEVVAVPSEAAWLHSTLLACLLQAAGAGRESRSIESAFAAALRSSFEQGLTRERLLKLGHGFARAIWVCGGNPRPIQRSLHRQYLESMIASGAKVSVKVFSEGDCCKQCQRLAGRVWTLEAALAENPLPCRDCLEANEGGFGWCRCTFEEVFLAPTASSIAQDAELDARSESARREILQEWIADESAATSSRWSSATMIQADWGLSIPAREAARIATDGWRRARNRGKIGFDGAIDALRAVGVAAGSIPNRERPVFNDILLKTATGETVVLMMYNTTWEFILRRD